MGYQGPRLPWSFPAEVAMRYPSPKNLPIARHLTSLKDALEWFRPTGVYAFFGSCLTPNLPEVNYYDNIRNISYQHPLSESLQHVVRLAYYAAITHVDDQVGKLLKFLEEFAFYLPPPCVFYKERNREQERDVGIICVITYDDLALEAWTQRRETEAET